MDCFFCGRHGKPTREHVIPRWLAQYLDNDIGVDGGLWIRSGEPLERLPLIWRRRTDLILRRVCASCNSGWMSRLESDAQQFLRPLIAGETIKLTPTSRLVLSRWALKTAAVLGPLQRAPDAVSPELRRRLADQRDLGNLVALWGVPHQEDGINAPHWRVGCDRGTNEAPAFNITGIALGKIAFEVAVLNRPDVLPPERIPPLTPKSFQYVGSDSGAGLCPFPEANAAATPFASRPTDLLRLMVAARLVDPPCDHPAISPD